MNVYLSFFFLYAFLINYTENGFNEQTVFVKATEINILICTLNIFSFFFLIILHLVFMMFINLKLHTFCTVIIFFTRHCRFLLTPLSRARYYPTRNFFQWNSISVVPIYFSSSSAVYNMQIYDGEVNYNNNIHEAWSFWY